MSQEFHTNGGTVEEKISRIEKWIVGHCAICTGKWETMNDHIKRAEKESEHVNKHLDEFERSLNKLYSSQIQLKGAVNTGKYVAGLIAGLIVGIVLLIGEALIRRGISGP